MKVFWALNAEQDRADIVDFIAQDNPRAAVRMDALFAEAASRLSAQPLIGKLAACRTLGIEAKIRLSEGRFRRFCRAIVGSIAQKSGGICTVQADLQPISLKSDRLLGQVPGTREFIVHESYRLVYAVEADTLWILALVHTVRLWPGRNL